jgi:hypothetical protein
LTKKRNTTGIESIVSIVANLTGKIGTTGIKGIVSIVANLTRKKVRIPRLLEKQAPILESSSIILLAIL